MHGVVHPCVISRASCAHFVLFIGNYEGNLKMYYFKYTYAIFGDLFDYDI